MVKKTTELNKRFRKNLVQLIIGSVMLFFVFWYLNNKDSEKRAFFGGFEIIWQKANIAYLSIVDPTRGTILSQKYEIEKSIKEMELMIQSCNKDSKSIVQLETLKYELMSSKLEDFANTISEYKSKISNLYEAITLECQKTSVN